MAERAHAVPAEGTLERAIAEFFVFGGPGHLVAGDVVQITENLPAYLARSGFVVVPMADAAILAEELDARADTLELAARSGARLPSYRGGPAELGQRVRVLRKEAKRLRGTP